MIRAIEIEVRPDLELRSETPILLIEVAPS